MNGDYIGTLIELETKVRESECTTNVIQKSCSVWSEYFRLI